MSHDDNKTTKIVLGVIGCLGCAGAIVVIGVLGLGYWVTSTVLMPPVPMSPTNPLSPTTLAPPIAPMMTPGFVTPPTPIGWSQYEHSSVCPNNDNLRLPQFRAAYPAMYKVLRCQEQEPRPWSYVTFHLEDAEGHADSQITLGYARGFPTQAMMESAAAQVVGQLGAPAPRLIDVSPFPARGAILLQRNAVFTVPTPTGVFLPGPFLIRQVVVPGAGPNQEGITVTLIQRVRTTEEAAVFESTVTLQHAISSIQF